MLPIEKFYRAHPHEHFWLAEKTLTFSIEGKVTTPKKDKCNPRTNKWTFLEYKTSLKNLKTAKYKVSQTTSTYSSCLQDFHFPFAKTFYAVLLQHKQWVLWTTHCNNYVTKRFYFSFFYQQRNMQLSVSQSFFSGRCSSFLLGRSF